jgi:Tol biopolymer transport system component
MGTRVLSIVSLANGVERELSPPLNYFQRPRWSPDGRTLLVNGTSPSGRQGLFAVDAVTAQATPFFLVDDDGSSYGHAWSRDGSTVYFTARDSRGSFIAAKRTGADGVREVYRPAGDAGASDGSVSPDGRWLAFREGDRRADILKVLTIGGGAAARAVYEVPRPDMMPAFGGINWTPDGRALLFVRGSGPLGDRRELWRVGIDGSAPRKLGLSMRGMNDVRLHPDGRQVTFSALDGHSELWALEHVFDSPASKARR